MCTGAGKAGRRNDWLSAEMAAAGSCRATHPLFIPFSACRPLPGIYTLSNKNAWMLFPCQFTPSVTPLPRGRRQARCGASQQQEEPKSQKRVQSHASSDIASIRV